MVEWSQLQSMVGTDTTPFLGSSRCIGTEVKQYIPVDIMSNVLFMVTVQRQHLQRFFTTLYFCNCLYESHVLPGRLTFFPPLVQHL